jgi:hypothetical protein
MCSNVWSSKGFLLIPSSGALATSFVSRLSSIAVSRTCLDDELRFIIMRRETGRLECFSEMYDVGYSLREVTNGKFVRLDGSVKGFSFRRRRCGSTTMKL